VKITSIGSRVLPLLQLTRMALVFTALADGAASVLILAEFQRRAAGAGSVWGFVDPVLVILIAGVSVGLYGFGMSLNDIVDRRRDALLAAHRPLPSGRVSSTLAHATCVMLAILAVSCGALYAVRTGDHGYRSLVLLVWTGALITFYDFAGKYLVAPGLLTLGLIRFFHATVPAWQLPMLWQALWLLNHVVILSTICYAWEEKRPPLTRRHWVMVIGGLLTIDALAIGSVWWRRVPRAGGDWMSAMSIEPGLIYPALASLAFIGVAWWVTRRAESRRRAGQDLMLYGLLWLIVYDAAFVAGYVNVLAAVFVLMLLPVAWLAVRVMRVWGGLVGLARRPEYVRAGSTPTEGR